MILRNVKHFKYVFYDVVLHSVYHNNDHLTMVMLLENVQCHT